MANLLRYLKKDRILLDMEARRKTDAIRKLASVLEGVPEIPDFRRFLSALFQKESRYGTGVGEGVAIPHYRDDTVREPAIAIGISRERIDWGDEQPVRILVLIGWPNRHDQLYLKTVAEIALLLRQESVRQMLLEARTPAEVIEIMKGEGVQITC